MSITKFRARLLLVAPLILFSSALFAFGDQEESKVDTSGRYLILATNRTSTMQKQLKEAASAGFHVVSGDAGYNILLLEKDSSGKKHDFIFTDSIANDIDKGKSKGFRVLPFTFAAGKYSLGAVLEKLQEGETEREYRVLQTIRTANFQKDLNAAAAEGFRLVALSGSEINYGLMEREPGTSSGLPDRYLLLATSKVGTMEKELLEAVDRGYRVVAATGAHKEMLVVLEKPEPGAPKPEYRVLSTMRSGTLEKEITEAGHAGYRLLPLTLCALEKSAGLMGTYGTEIAVIMEKVAGSHSFDYKMLSTKRVGTLEKELAQLESGWSVNRLALNYDGQIIVLERAAPSTD